MEAHHDNERYERAKRDARSRGVLSLGGFRAADDFRAERFTPNERTAAAFEAVQAFNRDTENLYLHGPTGTGKSHLAAVAARKSFTESNWSEAVRTVTPMEISREMRSCADAAHETEIIRGHINRRVLVIEDIGVAKDTEFLQSVMYEIINGRYQDEVRGGLIVTSNLSLTDLARKLGDDRVPSRLAQMCRVFSLVGVPDHRVPARKP